MTMRLGDDDLGADALMAYLDDSQCLTPPVTPQPQRTVRAFHMPSASPTSLPPTPNDLKAVTSPVATESTKAPSASASASSTPENKVARFVARPTGMASLPALLPRGSSCSLDSAETPSKAEIQTLVEDMRVAAAELQKQKPKKDSSKQPPGKKAWSLQNIMP